MLNPIRRWLPLQFSLRALLLATTLVGIGLMIFRWPWVETELIPDDQRTSQRTTTYRRGWNGKPLKHGLCIWEDMHSFYHDGELCWKAEIDFQGREVSKRHYQNGKLHGPFFDYGGAERGQFRQDKRDGKWLYVDAQRSGSITSEQWYARGEADGDWTWALDGETLQRARFERGSLTHWNGQPAKQALSHWLRINHVDPTTCQVLGLNFEDVVLDQNQYLGSSTFQWRLSTSELPLIISATLDSQDRFFSDWINLTIGDQSKWRKQIVDRRTIGQELLERALRGSRSLSYRFGVICIVPIDKSELEWSDQTGISAVTWEAGSPEAAAWEEQVVESLSSIKDVKNRLQKLFAGTPIHLKAENLRGSGLNTTRYATGQTTVRRSRRDILGLILSNEGWTCHKNGNRLEIAPKSPE